MSAPDPNPRVKRLENRSARQIQVKVCRFSLASYIRSSEAHGETYALARQVFSCYTEDAA